MITGVTLEPNGFTFTPRKFIPPLLVSTGEELFYEFYNGYKYFWAQKKRSSHQNGRTFHQKGRIFWKVKNTIFPKYKENTIYLFISFFMVYRSNMGQVAFVKKSSRSIMSITEIEQVVGMIKVVTESANTCIYCRFVKLFSEAILIMVGVKNFRKHFSPVKGVFWY